MSIFDEERISQNKQINEIFWSEFDSFTDEDKERKISSKV